jgi:4-amino-4-deoxy-L-arabinose transferase-like glycosyltransferase
VSASRSTLHAPRLALWVAVFLLWLIFAQTTLTATRTSLTIDEGLHITSGYSILRTGDYRLIEEHPPLVKMLVALPLLPVRDLPDPRTLPGWESNVAVTDSVRLVHATQALIYSYKPIDRLVVAARVPVALLAVLLGAIVFRWAKDLGREAAGLLALFLLAFDPNILAHASVASTDLGTAFFITLAMYTFWRFLRRPTPGRMALAGVTLGLAQATKLTGLLLLPAEVLMAVWHLIHNKRKAMVAELAGVLIIAALALWAVYRFEIGHVPGVPFPVPAASHAIPWLRLKQHIAGGHAAFLLGQVSSTGWWYYFPVAFTLKTPLPTLILLIAAWVVAGARSSATNKNDMLTLGLLPLLYFVSSMANPLNIGYRHLLPMLPFVFIFIGSQISSFKSRHNPRSLAREILNLKEHFVTLFPRLSISLLPYLFVLALLAWNIIGTVRLFPHYLAYFNELAGGSDGGWRYLADSNTDWGQALKDLAAYQRAEGIERVRLSMFTFMDPAVYGVHYEPLTPMLGNTPAVFPSRFNPPPGDYVISATTLQGIPLADPEMFDWFRKREPDAKIGHVMFLYHVQETRPRTWVAQCTTPVAPLDPPQIAEGFGRNDLRLAYFDCAQSWLYPTGGKSPGWFALARDAQAGEPRWLRTARLSYEQKRAGFSPPFRIYEYDGQAAYVTGREGVFVAPSAMPLPDALHTPAVDLPITFENGLTLLGFAPELPEIKPGETVHVETVWRVDSVPNRLLSIMAHALGPDGRVIAAGDGLGVPIESWQPGDIFIQRHTLTVPKDAPSGSYWLQTGVYWLDDALRERWPVQDVRALGDRLLLTTLEVR